MATPQPITATYEDALHWKSYSFTIGRKKYFLPQTPEEPYWECLRDLGDEYRTVAKGPEAVTAFLVTHSVNGVLIDGTLPTWDQER